MMAEKKRFSEGKRAMQLAGKPDYDTATRSATISFSSEYPVERMAFGQLYREVLSHDAEALDFTRLEQSVNVIDSHQTGSIDHILGVVEKAWIGQDRRGYARLRFADTERGQQAAQMVADGILRNVSFGYRILEYREPDADTLLVTRWQPFEVSLLSTPADPTVGYGRALESAPGNLLDFAARETVALSSAPAEHTRGTVTMQDQNAAAGANNPHISVTDNAAAGNNERLRIRAIMELARKHKVDDATRDGWIDGGATLDQCTAGVLDIMAQRQQANPHPASELGLTKKETERYSLFRALEAIANKNWSNASYELRCSQEVQKRVGRLAKENTFFIPWDVQARQMQAQRDMTVGTASAGGYLVQTTNQGFIPLLRNRSAAFKLGATQLPGLQDNVAIPKLTAGATFGWLANEAAGASESTPTLGQLLMTPKTIAGYVELSRLLTIQSSPAAEAIAEADLAEGVAVAVDAAAFTGSGASGQPTGVINTAGIGAVTGTTLGYAGVLEFQTDVANANVVPRRGAYLTTPAVAALMAQRVKFASTASPLWEGNIWDGQMVGFPAMSTLQVPAANMLFGDFSSLVIGEWGVMQIDMNPYANFQAGIIGLRVMYSCDIGIRYAGAWSLATTIT